MNSDYLNGIVQISLYLNTGFHFFMLLRQLLSFIFIGFINTAIHWAIFFTSMVYISNSQMISNGLAFSTAVTFSFFVNAKVTFKKKASLFRYIIFVIGMLILSLSYGLIADKLALNPFIMLMLFSFSSLLIGFIYSKRIVFK